MLLVRTFLAGAGLKEAEEKEREDRIEIPKITDELDLFSNPQKGCKCGIADSVQIGKARQSQSWSEEPAQVEDS